MSSHIVLNNTVIQILWILSIYSLIRIASTRIVPRYSIFEWNYKTNVSKIEQNRNHNDAQLFELLVIHFLANKLNV